MSKQQHTPGPWAVNPVKAQVDSFVGGDALPVCQMLWPTDTRTEDETEANARLIAAAPELLEALQMLLSDMSSMSLEQCLTATRNARAAIAKATGGKSCN